MLTTNNLGLVTARANRSPAMDHFFCTRLPSETKCGESTIQSYLLPLYLAGHGQNESQQDLGFGDERRSNIGDEQIARFGAAVDISARNLSPEDIFRFAYAVFHSPSYRSRYLDFLKIDFPRLPLAGSPELFRKLGRLGNELVTLHLMESPKINEYITTLVGSGDFQVEKTSYSDETVWIDKAKTRGFRGVPAEVWNFQIGGYQVCHKWLKDRGPKRGNPGRVLTEEDIDHYQKIVVALSETIRIMAEIDEVIEAHGGWPGAFATENLAEKDLASSKT